MSNTTHYRVRWEIDVEATTKLEAARQAEDIMRTAVDGTRDQARVMNVRALNSPLWNSFDLADPDVDNAIPPILPPENTYVRAQNWKHFVERFKPLPEGGMTRPIEPVDVPTNADPHYWWTVVDYVPNSARLYLVPGFARANRLALIQCAAPWGGNPDDHPLYVYQ